MQLNLEEPTLDTSHKLASGIQKSDESIPYGTIYDLDDDSPKVSDQRDKRDISGPLKIIKEDSDDASSKYTQAKESDKSIVTA